MADTVQGKIKKVKLSNGAIYSIFDQDALRLDPDTNIIITGVDPVDEAILDGHLSITEINDVPLAQVQFPVLVQTPVIRDEHGNYVSGGDIKKQDIRQVLKNLGLITAKVENDILNLAVVDFPGSI